MLNNGIVFAIIDASEQMNRSIPHLVMLTAYSSLFLAIIEVI